MDILEMIEQMLGRGSVNRPGPDPRIQALEEMMTGAGEGAAGRGVRAMNDVPPWSPSGRPFPSRYQQMLQSRGELTGRDALDAYNMSNPPEYGDPGYPHEDDIMGY